MRAVDYAGDYLTRINQYVTQEVLPSRFGERFLQNQKISYVVTVPAIWSDKAKQQTRQAACHRRHRARKTSHLLLNLKLLLSTVRLCAMR